MVWEIPELCARIQPSVSASPERIAQTERPPVLVLAPSDASTEARAESMSAPGESGFFAAGAFDADVEDVDDELPDVVELEAFDGLGFIEERAHDDVEDASELIAAAAEPEEPAFARVGVVLCAIAIELAGEEGGARVRAALRGQGVSPTSFATMQVWRALLEGREDAGAPAQTLDQWAATLLAELLGEGAETIEPLRRRVRAAGIAAFGVLEAA